MTGYSLWNSSGSTWTGYDPPDPATCNTMMITDAAMPTLSSAYTSA